MRRRPLRAAAAVGALLLIPALDAGAQWLPRVAIGASAATADFRRDDAPSSSGMLLGAYGRVSFGRVALELGYAQGTLAPDEATGDDDDLVDGEAMLVVTVRPWLAVAGGTHVRALVTPSGTERWVRHEARVRVETDLVPGAMTADAEASVALAADVNRAGEGPSARGATVGVNVRVPDTALRLRLAYGIDRATVADAVEVLQAVSLQVTFGRR